MTRQGRSARWWSPAAVLALAAAYFLDPNPRLDFSVFDTRDAESYLALAQSLVAGRGYTRSLDPQFYIPHTTWPPGLPLLLAPWAALAGVPVNLLLIKLGMIAYAAIGIVLAYLYARRLSASPAVQLGVPFLLGLNPYYWQFSRMTDSEMPTVLWALVALLLAEIGWAKGRIHYGTAFVFGLVAGFGMVIRGSFLGAIILPLACLAAHGLSRREIMRLASRHLVYAAGFLLPFLAWLVRNSFIDQHALGQDGINQLTMLLRAVPVDPASPLRTVSQMLSDMRFNLSDSAIYQIPRSLVPFLWRDAAWPGLGALATPFAAAASVLALAVSCASRRNLPLIVMYGSIAALNVFYAAGVMTRLWVPVTCLVGMSLPLGAEALLRFFRSHTVARLGGVVYAAALAASLAFFIVAHDEHPYRDEAHAALARLFKTVRGHYHLDGNVLTPDPQAFGLYTGSKAPMSLPAIGVDPAYSYIILPNVEWNDTRLPGTLVARNDVWSLVKLTTPLRLAQIRDRYDCTHAEIPAMSVLTNCLIE